MADHKSKVLMAAFLLNMLIIVMEAGSALYVLIQYGVLDCIPYYTDDSNFLTLISSLIYVLLYRQKKPLWVSWLRFTATANLTLTFLISLLVLSPAADGGAVYEMLGEARLFHHTICPLLSIFSLLFLERDLEIPKSFLLLSLIPTVLYELVMTTLNILGIYYGPYPFLHVREHTILVSLAWALLIPAVYFLAAFVLYNIASERRKTTEISPMAAK